MKSSYFIATSLIFRLITLTTCVKVWLSMPWRHIEGWRYRGVAPLDGGEWITSSPSRFAPWKEPRYALKKRPGGPKIRSGRFGEANNSLPGDWFSWKFVCKIFKPRTSWLTIIINGNVAGDWTLDAVCYWCMVRLVYLMTCGDRICNKNMPFNEVVFWGGAFAQLWKATISFVISARPHGATRLPLDAFSWNLIIMDFWKLSGLLRSSLI